VKSTILCYFVAVILKVLVVNLLATLNFANVFLNKENVWKIKNMTKIKKTFFYIYDVTGNQLCMLA